MISAFAVLTTSKILPTWPTIPLPVMSSVVNARTNPIMAARPLSCSEKDVKPWGIFLLSLAAMQRVTRLVGATLALLAETVKEDVASGVDAGRARVGMAETKAIS